nr:hypothetical protein CFP56_25241 [Quercus suber]
MVEELEELWKKLMFTEEEDIKIELDSRSTKASRDVGKCYVVMKILTQRSINLDASRKNLRMLWKLNKGVQISKLEEEEDSNPRRGVVGLAYPMPMSRELPENGKVQKVMEKVEEKETKLGKSSKEKPTTKPDLVEGM